MQTSKIIVIAGPTASGKSALALNVAEELDGVVINADSMQVYKDIPILAATPTAEETARVPHKLYSIYDAAHNGNVVDWLKLCTKEINTARAQNKTPIVVGGTGLYIESLINGVTPIPETPTEIRQKVDDMLQNNGLKNLYTELQKIDTTTAERLNPNDTTRIRRAIEIWLHTGKNLTYWHSIPLKKIYDSTDFVLSYIKVPRETLDMRGRLRFDEMIKAGAIEEAKALVARNLPDSLPAMRALGVQELKAYIKGNCSLEEAIENAKLRTRQYAKRQCTWFNNRYKPDVCFNTGETKEKNFVDDIKKAHKYLAK
ncbi:MAG: tRNA (adenosine(37)-N6)-dimethylallyltransferase MiaA [Acetobacter sp.]|nr:tRNA (adenosine(37)-N6)-dimethylallyltransferase MiaA [Acetobacter sp.]